MSHRVRLLDKNILGADEQFSSIKQITRKRQALIAEQVSPTNLRIPWRILSSLFNDNEQAIRTAAVLDSFTVAARTVDARTDDEHWSAEQSIHAYG
ncbi:hypothetical protein RvY_13440 [Ramazzottius varieornatus]|uniref:Uncharacterized protein n=1 Tax=Ramazzottius varieornatus TaxID=947166 RepID=A0A1D1VT67_RAMVA|nr:hypothetical protein RvY_13440 [Ramazzottius varieornatus]